MELAGRGWMLCAINKIRVSSIFKRMLSQRELLKEKLEAEAHPVNPSEWGPPLWRILHWLAEQVGQQNSKILQADENEAWKRLFRILAQVLPCAMCRGHYLNYMKGHFDLDKISNTTNQIEKYELIRRWLFELHEDVNVRRGVGSSGITLDTLKEVYADLNFVEERNKFYEIAAKSVRKNIITRDSLMSLKTVLATLYGLYRPLPGMRK